MLKNKTIILTGSNKGIGLATLKLLAKNGADIFACARCESEAFSTTIEQFSQEYSVEIVPIYFDLKNEDEIKEAVKTIRGYKKRIDGLVNNAGVISNALFSMTSMETFRELFEVNYFAQMQFLQYAIKLMIKNKNGSIVNIASSAALFANRGLSAYAGTKSALITTSKALSKELGEYNIRVNSISPGFTDTDLLDTSISKEELTKELEHVALKRVAKPDEIANAILFLLSDSASYISGQTIGVDGGMY